MSAYLFSFYSKSPAVKVVARKWWEIWKHDEVHITYEDLRFSVPGLDQTEANILKSADGAIAPLIMKVASAITKAPITMAQLETEPAGREYISIGGVTAEELRTNLLRKSQ